MDKSHLIIIGILFLFYTGLAEKIVLGLHRFSVNEHNSTAIILGLIIILAVVFRNKFEM